MKTNKFLLSVLSLFLLLSCNNDDDSSQTASIVGKWTFEIETLNRYYTDGTETSETLEWTHHCSSTKDYIEYRSNGTGVWIEYDENCVEDIFDFEYNVSGNTLTHTYLEFGEEATDTLEILSISNDTFTYKFTESPPGIGIYESIIELSRQ